MTDPYSDLHATAAMRALRGAESEALAPELGGLHGEHGLCVCAANPVELPRTPMLAAWVRVILGDDARFEGSVHARSDEPLPFRDETFRVAVLSHVLEWTPHAAQLLGEVARVLEPDGLVVITGFRPMTAWWPWAMWRTRRCATGFSVIAPMWLRARLARHDIEICATHCFGPAWPTSRLVRASRGGGCYMLSGRKRRQAVTPLRLRDARSHAPAHVPLVTGVQRECA